MKACVVSVVTVLALVSCGIDQAGTNVASSTQALDEPDSGCTNGNCPPIPDSGCSNGNCPPIPDSGCSNGNCPPIPDSGCSNGNCPPLPDSGCTNGNCPPPPDAGHEPPPVPVCCIPVANVTQHLCCGRFDDVISCRLSTLPDHVVIHDAFLEVFCKPKKPKKCKLMACQPDWWPEEAEDPVLPPHCDFWDLIKHCK